MITGAHDRLVTERGVEIEVLEDGTCAECGEKLEQHTEEDLRGCAAALARLRGAS